MGIRHVYLLILTLLTSAQFIYPDEGSSHNQVRPPPLDTLAQVPVWVFGSTYHIQWTLQSDTAGMKLWSYGGNFYTIIFAGYPNSGSYWWTVTFSQGHGILDEPFGNIFYLALYEDDSESATYISTFINITSSSTASTSTTFSMQSSTYLTSFDASTSIISTSSSSPRTLAQLHSWVVSSGATLASTTQSRSTEPPVPQLSAHPMPISSSMTTCLKTSRASAGISTLTLTITTTLAPSRNSPITTSMTPELQPKLGTSLGIPLSFIFGVIVGLIIKTCLQKRKLKTDAEQPPGRVPKSTGTRREAHTSTNPEAPDRSHTRTNSALVKARISRIGSMTLSQEIEMTSQDDLLSGNSIQGNYGEVPQGRAEVPGARGVEVDGAPMTAELIFVLKDTPPVSSQSPTN